MRKRHEISRPVLTLSEPPDTEEIDEGGEDTEDGDVDRLMVYVLIPETEEDSSSDDFDGEGNRVGVEVVLESRSGEGLIEARG